MNHQIQAEEERALAMRVETDAAERDQLAQCGLSTEEMWPSSGSDAGTKLAGVTAWSFCATGSSSSGSSEAF